MDPFEDIGTFLDQHINESSTDDFHLFEPWDVEERPDWLIREAKSDDVDLNTPENIKLYGGDPHPFQTGFMTDTGTIAVLFAGNRVGKSYCAIIDMVIKATGELPYAFRYPKGVKTVIKRKVNDANIRRWGRHDAETDEIIDHDIDATRDDTWDCGFVTGVGIYPSTSFIKSDTTQPKVIWVGTKKQAWEEFWWPKFKEIIPKYMLDTTRGTDGLNQKQKHIYLTGGYEIHGLTYDQGAMSFEAVEVPYAYMDEEAPMAVYAALLLHCTKLRIMETPYKGVTWTYDMLLLRAMDDNSAVTVYHATQYDSPYVTEQWVKDRKDNIKRWEVKARIYGIHSDQAGRPYYEERLPLLRKWCTSMVNKASYVEFVPTQAFDTYRDLCNTQVNARTVLTDQERGQWHLYEKCDPNTAYWIGIDTAEGSEEDEQAAADRNAAKVFRAPRANENPNFPVLVAACRSTDTTINFARTCVYAAVYYNNALLAPEVRGETGGVFKTEVRDYPYIYQMTVTNNKTNRPSKKIGYITSAGTRQQLFDMLGDFLSEFDQAEIPAIPYLPLIKEIMACLVGKKGRPDHPRNGTSDSIISFGIGLYVFQIDNTQIKNNKRTQQEMEQSRTDWYEARGVGSQRNKRIVFKGRR